MYIRWPSIKGSIDGSRKQRRPDHLENRLRRRPLFFAGVPAAVREVAVGAVGRVILSSFWPLYIHFDGKCYKVDGNGHLGGEHLCAIVRGSISFGRSEEAENPVASRQ
jgi:hypothetical protein